MTKFNPAIADKGKWEEKTVQAIRKDMQRHKGMVTGYAICFFDPFATDKDKVWSYALRTAHDGKHMDPNIKERLEASLRYIMAGVQKIFNVDIDELRAMYEKEDEFTAKGSFH